ncbi:hypothetical protein B0T16DRAFT_32870 [Cercophora newfieldiana]|uniref:Uncharacterized protein n=1 Tax=Cercophora newfieldiana TaxID=92897 RepID=A0AA39YQH6_9PEZI|nr:hypothetical protein B0T16DRAFT_32870 [Cercophora newfieldiana]
MRARGWTRSANNNGIASATYVPSDKGDIWTCSRVAKGLGMRQAALRSEVWQDFEAKVSLLAFEALSEETGPASDQRARAKRLVPLVTAACACYLQDRPSTVTSQLCRNPRKQGLCSWNSAAPITRTSVCPGEEIFYVLIPLPDLQSDRHVSRADRQEAEMVQASTPPSAPRSYCSVCHWMAMGKLCCSGLGFQGKCEVAAIALHSRYVEGEQYLLRIAQSEKCLCRIGI